MTFSGASLVLSSAGRMPPWHRAEKLLASFEMSSGHNRDTGSIYIEISAAAATGCKWNIHCWANTLVPQDCTGYCNETEQTSR